MPFPTVVDTITDGPTVLHASQVLGPQRVTVGPSVYNVKSDQYGAAGDGTTDDSTAINAAIAACSAAGGGTVYFPAGTYVASSLTFFGKIHYLGAGIENTILKLRTGSATNVPLIQSNAFATLASGGGGAGPGTSVGGESNFCFEHLTLDGNKANVASTVPMLRIYGFGFILQNLRLRNSNNVNLYSEWASSLTSPGPDSMEAHAYGLKVHDAGSDGVTWNGPHDSNWVNAESFNNGGRGYTVAGNGNGTKFVNCHGWGLTQTYAWYFNVAGCSLVSCVAEGASVAQIALNANDSVVVGCNVFAAGGTGTTGVIIGDTGSVVGSFLDLKVQNCVTASVNFKNDGGSFVRCLSFQTSGPAYIGTVASATYAMIQVGGGGTAPLMRVPTTLDVFGGQVGVHAGNAVRLYNAADSSFADVSFDGTRVNTTWPVRPSSLLLSRQTPTETVLVSGINGTLGDVIAVTLTAARVVGAPTSPLVGQRLVFTLIQGGAGAFAVTWNAVFKKVWSDTGNATGARSSIAFVYDGTNWNQDGAQAPYV